MAGFGVCFEAGRRLREDCAVEEGMVRWAFLGKLTRLGG